MGAQQARRVEQANLQLASTRLQIRLDRALIKALDTPHKARYVGQSRYTEGYQFMVLSATHAGVMYYPVAHKTHRFGGFCYAHEGEPEYYIVCDCKAGMDLSIPCWHAAKVHLYLLEEEMRASEGR